MILNSDKDSVAATSGTLHKVLWETVRALSGERKRAVIASSAGISKRLLKDLLKFKDITEVRAFVGGGGRHAIPNVDPGKGRRVSFVTPATRGELDLHGKLFYCENSSEGVLFVGSANFTWAAYTGANVEAGIVIRGRRDGLSNIVRRLLAGRWKAAAPNAKASEPEDEIDDHGTMQRLLAGCVDVNPEKKQIRIKSARIGTTRILRVELARRSTSETLETTDVRRGWNLQMHADVLDQELVFHLSNRRPESLWLAALAFDDSPSEVGRLPLSVSDIFRASNHSNTDHQRGGGQRTQGQNGISKGTPLTDVRFPWHILPALKTWSGDRNGEAERYARRLVDGDGSPAGALRAAIVREVILASVGKS